PRQHDGIVNMQTATVIAVSRWKRQVTVRLQNGKKHILRLDEPRDQHWDYAWSGTVYTGQGKTGMNVMAQFDSEQPQLNHLRLFYTVLTRPEYQLLLYADNKPQLIQQLERYSGHKRNATPLLRAYQQLHSDLRAVATAPKTLAGRIYAVDNIYARWQGFAECYVAESQHDAVDAIVSDKHARERITDIIRYQLKQQQRLTGKDVSWKTLRAATINRDASPLIQGMVVQFSRSRKRYGIEKNEQWDVVAGPASSQDKKEKWEDDKLHHDNQSNEDKYTPIDAPTAVTLHHADGRTVTMNHQLLLTRQGKGIQVFQVDNKALCIGEQLLWTKSYLAKGIHAAQMATITAMTHHTVTCHLASGKFLTLPHHHPALQHWRYAYVRDVTDRPTNKVTIAIGLLDNSLQASGRQAALLASLGETQRAYLYTNHEETPQLVVENLLGDKSKQLTWQFASSYQQPSPWFVRLATFDKEQRITGQAWVSYFQQKKHDSTHDTVTTATLLERAQFHQLKQDNAAHHVRHDEQFAIEHAKALGISPKTLYQAANRHQWRMAVNNYSKAQGLYRGQLATQIVSHRQALAMWVKTQGIDKHIIHAEAEQHHQRLAKLAMTPQQRKATRWIASYLTYHQQATHLQQRLSTIREKGSEPSSAQRHFSLHVMQLRNQLALAIQRHRKSLPDLLQRYPNTFHTQLQRHADAYSVYLQQQHARQSVVDKGDWKKLVDYDTVHCSRSSHTPHLKKSTRFSKNYIDKAEVLQRLTMHPESLLTQLLGDKNNQLSRPALLAWGNKGSVKYHVSGGRAGLVSDYESGFHGDLISFYAERQGIAWQEALKTLAAQMGMSKPHCQSLTQQKQTIRKQQQAVNKKMLQTQQRNRMRAQTIWQESVPIPGTLAETYLKQHRGIAMDFTQTALRFHSAVVVYRDDMKEWVKQPALIVAVKDDAGNVLSIQRVFLHPKTANKDNRLRNPKMSLGLADNRAACIQRGNSNEVIIAEGPETAVSIAAAKPHAAIYVSLGKSAAIGNFSYLAKQHNTNALLIAADNDVSKNKASWQGIESAAKQLHEQGIIVNIAVP
ncbi:MAG: toprim domain-containing protein, partial [Gammaproteobacteria bacterium]|nr:toprim domain-containing protein [Gammaproteobacteria bacterium]